jgi:hypothetical protein
MASVDTIDKTERDSGDTVSLRDYSDARSESLKATVGQVSLREYVDGRLTGLKDLYDSRFDSQKESITVARDSMDKRLAGMNEFRQQMSDMAGRFASRDETNTTLKYLSDRVSVIESGLVTRPEHTTYQASLSNQLTNMQTRLTAIESAKQGASEIKHDSKNNYSMLIATIAAATGILVLAVAWNHTTPPAAPVYTNPVPTVQTVPAPTK